jgi:hypothetical protein
MLSFQQFNGREVLEGKAHIDPDFCLGCER